MIEFLESTDKAVFLFINSFHFNWLNPVMSFISGPILWFPLIIFIVWKAHVLLSKKLAYTFILFVFVAVFVTDATSSSIIKNIVSRLRPCRIADIKLLINHFGQKCGGKYGFVSSHAANAMALVSFTFLSLSLKCRSYWWLWAFPIVIGWSRVYLGVHYPGDIIGGYIIGLLSGYGFYVFFRNIPKVQASEVSNLKVSTNS